jgi:ribosome-associated toxin RatA of RatAB toxin-antitoxin module
MNKISDLSQVSDSPVEIKIEKREGRQRHVFAKIQIPYSLEQVWQVLTNYEAFFEFMPNITQSKQSKSPTGGIRIEQVRTKSLMGLNISGRSVFDVEEKFPDEIHYQLIEGDLKEFSAYWRLEAWQPSEKKVGVDLIYEISVLPKPIIPMTLVESVLTHDIPNSLLAVRQRVENLFCNTF